MDFTQMHAVAPKLDCPHLPSESDLDAICDRFGATQLHQPCCSCADLSENWMCLQCEQVYCSRYVNEHMLLHCLETEHRVVLSFSDASFWCYQCESYVYSSKLGAIARKLGAVKFPEHSNSSGSGNTLTAIEEAGDEEYDGEGAEAGEEAIAVKDNSTLASAVNAVAAAALEASAAELSNHEKAVDATAAASVPARGSETVASTADAIPGMDNTYATADKDTTAAVNATTGTTDAATTAAEEESEFNFDALVSGLREKRFSRVCFLTGAGISVAAGIPDFRTPGSGLYSKVAALGLPYPEAVFSLEYLQQQPAAFYAVANGFLTHRAQPVKAHHFMRLLEQRGMLQMVYTQNIDGLELAAGLPLQRLVQAHGHMRSAHCAQCKADADIDDFFIHVAQEKVLYCSSCSSGVVKPDIVFFGENLPASFHDSFHDIRTADLVVVMGTSLQVFPFAGLLSAVPAKTPLLLLNRENPGIDCAEKKLLFLPGDIEDSVQRICSALNWQLPGVEHTDT